MKKYYVSCHQFTGTNHCLFNPLLLVQYTPPIWSPAHIWCRFRTKTQWELNHAALAAETRTSAAAGLAPSLATAQDTALNILWTARASCSLFTLRDSHHSLYLALPLVSSHTRWDFTDALFSVCHFLICPHSLLSCRITQPFRFKKTSRIIKSKH